MNDSGWSYGCAWADCNGDRFPDLFLDNNNPNQNKNNSLYLNNGDGTFTKITEGQVVSDDGSSYGCTWGDYDNSGFPDLFVSNYNESNFLYQNSGDGTFTKITDSPVVNDATWSGGGAWADFDNDGDLDLFVGGYDGHNRLYENDGTGVFTSIDTGVVVTDGNYIMGSAWADYDRDGDLDLFTARNNYFGGASCLYRNDGNAGHWLSVRCIGTVSNRMAIGARVRVKAAIGGRDVWQVREVSAQTGGCNSGQSSVNASFGLGDADVVDSLVVRWPSGIVQVLTGVPINQFLTVTEQQTAVSEGPAQGRQAVLGFLSCPNPVQGRAFVSYGVPKDGYVRLAFFDIQGRKLRTLVSTVEPVGVHVVVWDGADSDGRRLPGGTYFIRLDTEGGAVTRAVVVAR